MAPNDALPRHDTKRDADEKQPANMNCHKMKFFSSIGAQSDCKRRKTPANAEELVAAVAVPDLYVDTDVVLVLKIKV